MFWKIVATLGAVTFLVAGLDALSLDCDAVEFGGSRRSVTYSCTAPGADGGMSPGAAGALMLLGALAILVVAWGPSVYRATADTRDLKQGSWNQFTAGTDTPSREEPEQHLQTPATPTLTDEAVSETLLRSEVSNLEGPEAVFAPLLAVDPQHAAPSTSREDRRNNGTVDAGQAAGLKAKDSTARADIAESLRQLKALHDEGLLTKDEYETKRKALADQL